MKSKRLMLFGLLVPIALISFTSCEDWGKMDPPSGVSYTGWATSLGIDNPTIAFEDGHYYVASSCADMSAVGIEPNSGIVIRRSDDLKSFRELTENNAFILSDIADWAARECGQADAILSQPSLHKLSNGEWAVAYVCGDGENTIIGVATSKTIEGNAWKNQGVVVKGAEAQNPSILSDGTNDYLVYGDENGVYVQQLSLSSEADNKSEGVAKKIIDGASDISTFVEGGKYYILYVKDNAVYQAMSEVPESDYKSVRVYDLIAAQVQTNAESIKNIGYANGKILLVENGGLSFHDSFFLGNDFVVSPYTQEKVMGADIEASSVLAASLSSGSVINYSALGDAVATAIAKADAKEYYLPSCGLLSLSDAIKWEYDPETTTVTVSMVSGTQMPIMASEESLIKNGLAYSYDVENQIIDIVFSDAVSAKLKVLSDNGIIYALGYEYGENYTQMVQFSTKQLAPTNGAEEDPYTLGIGLEDCTTPWWTPEYFLDLVHMGEGDVVGHVKFRNTNNGSKNNWCNWVIAITNNKAWGEEGYSEYCVLRSDYYGWGGQYGKGKWSGTPDEAGWDWATFPGKMDGAIVDVTLRRVGTTITMTSVATKDGQEVFKQTFTIEGAPTDDMGFFILCEGSYLQFDPRQTYGGKVGGVYTKYYPAGSYIAGLEDCSTPWWTPEYFTKQVSLGEGDCECYYKFVNYNNGTKNNWCNWVIVITSGKGWGEDGYSEYCVLRSDYYGWGGQYSKGKWSGTPDEAGWDWATFPGKMDGATVEIRLKREGTTITMASVATKDGQEVFKQTFTITDAPTTEMGSFLLCEGSYLDMLAAPAYIE